MSQQYTLLYAEDEIEIRKSYIRYIEAKYNFKTYEADDGEEALKLYHAYQPDILITDITMPKINGLELIKKVRELSYDTKVIVLTAHSEQNLMVEALDLYVVNYLIKPISRKKLCKAIDIALKTLPQKEENNNSILLNEYTNWDTSTCELYQHNQKVKLTSAERSLLEVLCKNRNTKIDSIDIYLHIWDNPDKEFSADAVRTLVKKIRKKLPDNLIENIYGGYYRLNTDCATPKKS